MKNAWQGLILISGIPGSGKSYFSKMVRDYLIEKQISAKILSADNLQCMMNERNVKDLNKVIDLLKDKEWQIRLSEFELNKQIFNEQYWKLSRELASNSQLLTLLLNNCQILIIEDQFTLKSQRKPFKKFCFQAKIKYLEVELSISLQQALQNNDKRGQSNKNLSLSAQIIKKSFHKFQHNDQSLVINKKITPQCFQSLNIIQKMQYVIFNDNYSEYLLKKSIVHQSSQNQLDEKKLRKLIASIIENEEISKQYFSIVLSKQAKAQILLQCKKNYIQRKRSLPFRQIIEEYLKENSFI